LSERQKISNLTEKLLKVNKVIKQKEVSKRDHLKESEYKNMISDKDYEIVRRVYK